MSNQNNTQYNQDSNLLQEVKQAIAASILIDQNQKEQLLQDLPDYPNAALSELLSLVGSKNNLVNQYLETALYSDLTDANKQNQHLHQLKSFINQSHQTAVNLEQQTEISAAEKNLDEQLKNL